MRWRKQGTIIGVLLLSMFITQAVAAKTTIRWTEWPRPHQDELVQKLISSFEAAHPDIEVKYEPMSSEAKVTVGMAAGASPDVIGYWGTGLSTWMQQGAFLNLDSYLEKYHFDYDDFNPMQLGAFAFRGHQYILPHYLGTGAMMYNKDRFQEVGVEEPDANWTWDDRRVVGRKLNDVSDDGVERWGNLLTVTSLDRVANLISANGGTHHPAGDNSVVLWDRPEAIGAMEYWRKMIFEDQSAPTVAQFRGKSYREMFSNQLAFTFENLAIDLAHFEEANFKIGITQNPSGPAKRVTLATTDGFGVWAGTPNPDAAVQFLLFLVSPEVNKLRAELQSLQPARQSVMQEWVDITLQRYPFVTREDVMQFYYAGQFAEPVPTWSDPEVAARSLRLAMNKIYALNQPASAVMAETIPALNATLQEHKQANANK